MSASPLVGKGFEDVGNLDRRFVTEVLNTEEVRKVLKPSLKALLLVAIASGPAVAAEPPVAWRTDYEAAKLQAAGEGKLLFIQILTDS